MSPRIFLSSWTKLRHSDVLEWSKIFVQALSWIYTSQRRSVQKFTYFETYDFCYHLGLNEVIVTCSCGRNIWYLFKVEFTHPKEDQGKNFMHLESKIFFIILENMTWYWRLHMVKIVLNPFISWIYSSESRYVQNLTYLESKFFFYLGQWRNSEVFNWSQFPALLLSWIYTSQRRSVQNFTHLES